MATGGSVKAGRCPPSLVQLLTEKLPQLRAQLRLLNDARWRDELPPPLGKLDSSFKKNTAFAKKLRTAINQEGLAAVLRDIRGLSLEKYLSEVVASVTEGVLKCTKLEDVWAAVEIVSALHQRFGAAFTSPLLANVLQLMATAAVPPLSTARQAAMMRVVMELCLVGVFRTVSDCARDALPAYVVRNYTKVELKRVVVVVLRDVLLEDIANGGALPVAVAFLRRFGALLYPETKGAANSEGTYGTEGTLEKTCATASDADLAWLEDVRHVLRAYAQATLKALTLTHAGLAALNGRIKKTSVRTGRIPEELTAERDATNAVFEAMRDALQSFVEAIDGLVMPQLANPVAGGADDDAQVEVVRREDDLGVWDSVETRNFYTRIPIAALVETEGASTATEDTLESEVKGSSEGDSSDAAAGAAASGERMRDIVGRLDAVSTTAELDSLAADFTALNLTNKASKNRLFKWFLETGEISKLKFFARFLAIHRVALADVIDELIEYVDRGFRTQIYRSASRINFKNVLFFCELIRFKLVPLHVVFHKIRALTLSVAASNNLDLLLVVYEQCGRFLLHEPQYRDDMREMVALLKLKRANEQFLINDKMGINGLLVIVEPPVGPSVGDAGPSVGDAMGDAGHRDPEALFCQHLLRVELKPSNVSLVVRLLRKVDLNLSAVRRVLVQCLTTPEQTNYESIPQLAVVLANVSGSPTTQWLRVEVIDTVLEKVIRGLELTDYRLARLRVADIKYVAALYNFGLVEWRLVRVLLYKVLTTGHPNMQPLPLSLVETDLPDNYLRIQLCCVLLTHLTRTPGLPLGGSWKQHELKRMKRQARAELGQFMCFFEYYMFTKQQPIPRETEFRVSDLFKKLFGGQYERATDLGGAVKKLQAVVAARGDDNAVDEDADAETSEADDDDDDDDWGDSADIVDEEEEEVDEEEDEEDEGASEEEREDDNTDVELTDDLDLSDSSSSASDSAAALHEEQILALDRDIQKMVLDLYAHTLLARKLAVAVPSKKVMELAATAPAKTRHSAFTFLTKKGKKTSATQVLLPDDLRLSASKRRGDNDEREHRERIMQLVRNME